MPKQLYIDLIRSDMSDWLVHCTTSFDKLKAILSQQALLGNHETIKGSFNCVCFSEAPLVKIKALTLFAQSYAESIGHKLRYAPFGVAVKKQWLFEQGGRPVIYQPESDYGLLHPSQQYRHVKYDPAAGFDFTWEREWRVQCDYLQLDPRNCTVFVESRTNLDELIEEFYGDQCNAMGEGLAYGIATYPWGLISLEEIS